jgi:exodeoxyribonuclease VII small subunit
MKKKEITFNEAISQIEEIVNSIESGEPDIDILSEKVKRASELIKLCREKLRETEKKIDEIIQEEEH